jgi:chromosome segregation ATPase
MVSEREHRLIEVSAEVEHLRTEIEQNRTREQQLRDEATEVHERIAAVAAELAERGRQLAVRNDELAEVSAELEQLRAQNAELEIQKQGLRDQLAGVEAELTEEKHTTENLSEVANERRERITKLNEQVEEATERYEEAKWRLGKAQYFERIVARRKGLIKALLAALRAKSKSNVALKAGLDGLRIHKATAELNQQKLLARIDSLKVDLEEAEATIERQHGATMAKEQLVTSEARVADLTTRLNTQAELIQSLEDDLKKARGLQKTSDEKSAEIDRLRGELATRSQELESKQQILNQLQTDADEQQRRLSKLRGSESETARLKVLSEQDRSARDALEREVAQLRETLTHQSQPGDATGVYRGGDELARLLTIVKEHEATIKKLSEAAEAWKRKYQFLATDTPDAFNTAIDQ